jgi:erythronate-4-phosphate dehydrogenase
MKLVVDENIAYAEGTFSGYGEVVLSHGRKITNEMLLDADALIVRSITKVNEALLKNTRVRFVGTATIGIDHVDTAWLAKQGITFADAKGCNADAVTEYVFTLLFRYMLAHNLSPQEVTLGVVGRGDIGGRIARLAPFLGLKLLVNDPPLQRAGVRYPFVAFDDVLKADILTFHTPLNREGPDKTIHLLTKEALQKATRLKYIINASRGEIADTEALLALHRERSIPLSLDVWENEPQISAELLRVAQTATPHIAGYSLEGKINGTMMMKKALDKSLGRKNNYRIHRPIVEHNQLTLSSKPEIQEILAEASRYIYDVDIDTAALKKSMQLDPTERGKYFDALRKDYNLRREFDNYTIELRPFDEEKAKVLQAFRFKVV